MNAILTSTMRQLVNDLDISPKEAYAMILSEIPTLQITK